MIVPRKSPLIIGHRGASAVAPENTLAAFARALDDSADGIELDVRLARDGVPVVVHDPTLLHTGSRKARVERLTSEALVKIDVGSAFNRKHPLLARVHYGRQTVPTLDAVFTFMANSSRPETLVYVEMKAVRKKKSNALLARAVVDLIRRHNFHRRAVVISFNLTTIAMVKKLDPSIRTGALFGPRQRAIGSRRRIVSRTLKSGADEILLHHLIAGRGILSLARDAKLAPVVWTVDDPRWVSRAGQNGIHAIMTNNPAKMLVRYALHSGLSG